jgi:hypothetical protein
MAAKKQRGSTFENTVYAFVINSLKSIIHGYGHFGRDRVKLSENVNDWRSEY